MGVFVRVQLITCRQIDSRVVVNTITAPKGRCRDYQKKHLTARKAFAGISVGLGLAFLLFWGLQLANFNFTSAVFAFCWIWNVAALYFLVSLGLHCSQAKVTPTLGPKILRKAQDGPTPVEPWSLCRSTALVLFQVAFDIAWAGLAAYGMYFVSQVTLIVEQAVMGLAFLFPAISLLLDLSLSQLVFVPLHFVFGIAFLFLWVLVLWAYTTVTGIIGDCSEFINATACMCSRFADNQSDIVQCYNASVGFCKWSEYGRCGWPYNPDPYRRVLARDLAHMFPDNPIECSYESKEAMEFALAANGSHLQGHCSGDYPDSMYSITDPLFFVYTAAACAAIFVAHGFGIIVTCIREAACPTTMKPVAAAHRCFVLPEPSVDMRFVDETGDVPTE